MHILAWTFRSTVEMMFTSTVQIDASSDAFSCSFSKIGLILNKFCVHNIIIVSIALSFFNQIKEHFELLYDLCIRKIGCWLVGCLKDVNCIKPKNIEVIRLPVSSALESNSKKKREDLCRPLKYGKLHFFYYMIEEKEIEKREKIDMSWPPIFKYTTYISVSPVEFAWILTLHQTRRHISPFGTV